jgi:hypothetical protein
MITKTCATLLALLLVSSLAVAQDKDAKPDPTGTWTWKVMGQNNQAREQTLKLKLDGDKLTGALVGRNDRETKIEKPTYKDGELSFEVTRERQGEKFTTKYTGKVSGDTIKGKMQFERNGQKRDRDWEAKREKK